MSDALARLDTLEVVDVDLVLGTIAGAIGMEGATRASIAARLAIDEPSRITAEATLDVAAALDYQLYVERAIEALCWRRSLSRATVRLLRAFAFGKVGDVVPWHDRELVLGEVGRAVFDRACAVAAAELSPEGPN